MKSKTIIFLTSFDFLLSCSEVKRNDTIQEITPQIDSSIQTNDENSNSEEFAFPQLNIPEDCNHQINIKIFRVNSQMVINNKTISFTSFSDTYRLSSHLDSSAIPDLKDKNMADAEYFVLDSLYRRRFLNAFNLSEDDSVFVFDYSQDTIFTFSVKNLKVTAELSHYVGSDTWPWSQEDYMIGFQIEQKLNEVIICAGHENPFKKGSIRPLVWQKTEAGNFPTGALNSIINSSTDKFKTGDTYMFLSDEYHYFLRDLFCKSWLMGRHLIVTKAGSKEIVKEKIFTVDEGTSLAKLNGMDEGEKIINEQWTGEIFKNLPPVIFGFQYHSFGCESIVVLDKAKCDINTKCDNRH